MRIFSTIPELVHAAIAYTTARLDSLEKDVDHCLMKPYAPLPALAYCFSTIDLMGALYKGNARGDAPTTEQSRAYMVDFMKYTDEQALLLQKIFRHKIVHLATPKAVVAFNSMVGNIITIRSPITSN